MLHRPLPHSTGSASWPLTLDGELRYCSEENAAHAPDDDGAVILQNASVVADALEEMGALDTAAAAYRYMLELAREGAA